MSNQLDLATAQGLVERTLDAARTEGLPVAAVVVDGGGHVVSAARMDGASFLMTEVAQKKATLAAAMGVPSQAVAQMAEGDALLAHAFAGQANIVALAGGLPITGDAGPIGGLGVAGGHYSQDQAIAEAALAG